MTSRWKLPWRQVLALMVVWLLLVGHVTVLSVVGGLLIGWLVSVLFPLPPIPYRGRLHLGAALRLVAVLVRDLAVASVSLAGYAFGKTMPVSGIIRVKLASDSDVYQVLTAQLNTVVPGTIVLDARQRTRTLYLHVFDASDPEKLRHEVDEALATERRVVQALGTKDELDAVDRCSTGQESA